MLGTRKMQARIIPVMVFFIVSYFGVNSKNESSGDESQTATQTDLFDRGSGVDSADLEIRIIYVDKAEVKRLEKLTEKELASAILALPEEKRETETFTATVWAGQATMRSTALFMGVPLVDKNKSIDPSANHLGVTYTVVPDRTWTDDIPLAVRCTCSGASSPDTWWNRDKFITSFVVRVQCSPDQFVAIGNGIHTMDGKKVMYSLVRLAAIKKAVPSTIQTSRPPAHPPLWSHASTFGLLDYEAQAMAVGSDGVYVLGYGRIIDSGMEKSGLKSGDMCWTLEKLRKDNGTSAENFGMNGIVLTRPGKEPTERRVITVDDQSIYVAAGLSVSGSTFETPESYWHIEKRDKMTGQLVTGFGKEGIVTSPDKAFGRGWMRNVRAIAVLGDHLYVLGSERTWTTSWSVRIEKRDKKTGTLIPEFGDKGVVLSQRPDYERDMAIQGDALFVIGKNVIRYARHSSQESDDFDWHIEKRNAVSGALAEGFGTKGIIRHNPTPGYEEPEGIAAGVDSIYVVGNEDLAKDGQWRIEKRDSMTGTLAKTFGVSGVITKNSGPWYDVAQRIRVDDGYMYISGQESLRGFGESDWRIEKRSTTTGALIPEFGSGGAIPFASPYWSPGEILDISLDDHSLYLLRKNFGIFSSNWQVEKRSKKTGGDNPN